MKSGTQQTRLEPEKHAFNQEAIEAYPFLEKLMAAANCQNAEALTEIVEKAVAERLADPCWICPLEACQEGDIMALVGTEGRLVHVCIGAASYPFDYREWWKTSLFELRRKSMIRVIEPENFAFESAFKMLLMPNPPRELPERYLMELRPDPSTGILFWVTPRAVDMKGMKVIRVLLQPADLKMDFKP